MQTWWNHHHLDNLLFVHYEHLKADVAGQIRRLAAFLDIAVDDETVRRVEQETTLDAMRNRAVERWGSGDKPPIFRDGARTFFFMGTNGRWRDVLTAADLQLYEAAAERELTPDCRAWLEQGVAT